MNKEAVITAPGKVGHPNPKDEAQDAQAVRKGPKRDIYGEECLEKDGLPLTPAEQSEKHVPSPQEHE